jgi:ribosomal protein S18 acetylase RimI-like enzyme
MTAQAVTVRAATRNDLDALGRLGASLMRSHYAYDPQRFMAPGPHPDHGYGRFLGSLLDQPDAAIFVAEKDGVVIGYVYAGLEPVSWRELRDAAGFVHDLIVDEPHRQKGVAMSLMEAALAWLRDRGAPRVVLGTAQQNAAAQRLFERLGFRRTMVEMTREL